jgi:hypothetical protein
MPKIIANGGAVKKRHMAKKKTPSQELVRKGLAVMRKDKNGVARLYGPEKTVGKKRTTNK